VFTILSDKEKRDFYDKYGTEEEFREKYQKQHFHDQRHMEEMDPFEIFEMFFSGKMPKRGNVRYHYAEDNDDEDGVANGNGNRRRRVINKTTWTQFLPLVLLFIMYVVTYLIQSVTLRINILRNRCTALFDRMSFLMN
jgi:hypothetical protein